MIRKIRGEYLYYERGSVVIETRSGIGFRVFVPDTSPLLLQPEGTSVELYTYLQVKEDGMALYGFEDRESLALFEQLLTVNGVGPKAGLAIMSIADPDRIKYSIISKDAMAIAKAQGVGKKTAERVILELCDKISVVPVPGDAEPQAPAPGLTGERHEAAMALTTLGYSKAEAEEAIAHVPEEEGLSAETYIKKALQYLL